MLRKPPICSEWDHLPLLSNKDEIYDVCRISDGGVEANRWIIVMDGFKDSRAISSGRDTIKKRIAAVIVCPLSVCVCVCVSVCDRERQRSNFDTSQSGSSPSVE